MKIIPTLISHLQRRVRSLGLCAALFLLSLPASEASPIAGTQPVSPAVRQKSQPSLAFQSLLAQSSLEPSAERFAQLVKPFLMLGALVLCVSAGYFISQGEVQKCIYCLMGAFVVLLSWVIVKALVAAAS
jgi:hypothetical protein